jgi:predicted permease
MPLFRRVVSTFRSLFRKAELDTELEEELQCHVGLLVDEKISAGMSAEEARRAALRELGGLEQVKEEVRVHRMGAFLDTVLQDARYALRTLRKSPGFTVVALLILAIGIGANTSLFSTIHTVLLRGVPFPEPGRLVTAQKTVEGRVDGHVALLDYFDYRERSEPYAQLAALLGFAVERVTGGPRAEVVETAYVTWNLFPVLGVSPILGRGFVAEDEEIGGDTAIIISHAYWQSRYGGAPQAVGDTLTLDGRPMTIIGIMPRGFRFLVGADAWGLIDGQRPLDTNRDSHSHIVIGRLAPGVTPRQAQEEATLIARGLERQYPESNTAKGIRLSGLQSYMVRSVRVRLLILMATTVLVLVIAFANVAGLLLARGERRRSEMAMRAALGASPGRMVRQLLTESLILTISAGMLGLGLAYLMQGVLVGLLPLGELGIKHPAAGAWALGFAIVVTVVSGLLVGVIPALRGSRLHPARDLSSGTRVTAGGHGTRLRSTLVVLQIAVTIVLLIGSGLLIRSLDNLSGVELGFDPHNLLTGQLRIQSSAYETREARIQFFRSLIDEIETLPGVVSAALTSKLPIRDKWQNWGLWRADRPKPLNRDGLSAMVRFVSPGYFDTMQIPVMAGREFSHDDSVDSPYVAILSRSVARSLFQGDDPVGRRVKIGWDDREFEIVGIVADARLNTLQDAPDGAAYMSTTQVGMTQLQAAVRTAGDPALLARPIEVLLQRKDPHAVFNRPASMESVVDGELAGLRVVTVSLSLFAGLALLLAAIGLYGVLAYHVGQRIHEFGIRLALGSSTAGILRMVLGRGLVLVAAGVSAGIAATYPGTLLLRQLLFGTQPLDLASYAGAIGFLVLVALLACLIPAWRATRVDVMEILRVE